VIWSWLAAGFVGTLVLTTVSRGASELGYTRMDLPFLLGTIVTENRQKAKAIGYVFHFLMGLAFAMFYGLFFLAIGRSGWWIGALLGVLHDFFVGAVLVSILLPIVHPRMGTPETSAAEIALIEPPGFMMLNYGRSTVLVSLVAHIIYGALVGLVARV
jgi:hypothetical protein